MRFNIVNIEEFSGPKAKIYSIMYEGDGEALIDRFFDDNITNHREELKEIGVKLYLMGNEFGCKANFFKPNEGAPGDGVVALRYKQMRLYCLRYDNSCIFIGSGGYKPPSIRAYQEDTFLNAKAEEMKKIAACINQAIKDKDLKIKEDGTLETSEFIEFEI